MHTHYTQGICDTYIRVGLVTQIHPLKSNKIRKLRGYTILQSNTHRLIGYSLNGKFLSKFDTNCMQSIRCRDRP